MYSIFHSCMWNTNNFSYSILIRCLKNLWSLTLPGASRQLFCLSLLDIYFCTQLLKKTISFWNALKPQMHPCISYNVHYFVGIKYLLDEFFITYFIFSPEVSKDSNNFNFWTKEPYILTKSLKVSQHVLILSESLVLSIGCSITNEMPSHYATGNLFYGKSYEKMDKNSHETLFQSNFLWKECPHWSDNRIPTGKCSIRSTGKWGIFRVLCRVACRSGWEINRGWRRKSHSRGIGAFTCSGQAPTVWFCKSVKKIFFKYHFRFVRAILFNSTHALILNV